ncbi:derlin-1 [Pristis pectinata]|uniref:derlin-1 n=1 Tax=Pristis pectinata TaxID=685728 RepID=UPI00223C8D80|nr:derlin-1 [Pristis pectinata]
MADSGLGEWYRGIPLVTRYWFTGCVVLPVLERLNVVSGRSLVLWSDRFFNDFQIWRPVTASLFYPMGFHYLIQLYFLYSYSSSLERGFFDGRTADYVFMLFFNWICTVIVALLIGMPILFIPLILTMVYVWAQLNKDQIVTFWFGMTFKACYLPWALLIFNYILRNAIMDELVGIFVGHMYYVLMFKYPQEYGGRTFLSTPQFLVRWFPPRRGGVSGFGVRPASRRPEAGGQGARWGRGYFWGQGQRLGDN